MSIRENAKAELERIKFGDEDTAVMLKLIDIFLDQWDSGGAVSVAAPVLMRLINGQPLEPLTGAEAEWYQPMDHMPTLQNKRCSSVFKDPDGTCYDIDVPGRPAITFPYDPTTRLPASPVIVF